jgi:feruloyl esterase
VLWFSGAVLVVCSALGVAAQDRGRETAATAPKVDCASLTGLTFEGNTSITSATAITTGTLATSPEQTLTNLPPFCRVVGVSKPTSDSNINFEVWLPTNSWNGKFLSSGEGGYAGNPNYTRRGLDGGLDAIIKRGYATASTDTGHRNTDRNWAIGHPEKVIDYAHRSKHLVTVAAKGVIAAYYGTPPTRSYFNSCSNGGRQALMLAQRYPNDYDGYVVGAPWNYQSHSAAGFIWDAQALSAPGAAIPESKLAAINKAVLEACDAKDGIRDGVIEEPNKCAFDPAVLLCKGADNDSCLTDPQVTALKKLYAGPSNPRTGESIFPGWALGSELGWRNLVSNVGKANQLGTTYFADLVYENPNWDFRTFDFDAGMAFADSKVGVHTNAIGTDYRDLKRRGVKIIQYHGWNEQTLQPGYSPLYYQKVTEAMGGPAQTQDFYRLFMVPGMTHCYFGPGANSFGALGQQAPPVRDALHDIQTALETWVEKGAAPDRMIATKYIDDAATTRTVKFQRLLCPYPEVARFKPSSDPNNAASFVCAKPSSEAPTSR